MTATTTHTTTVPAVITDLADDLTGFHPVLDRAVTALADLAAVDLTADHSQSLVAALGGFDSGSLATLLGLVVRHVADPDANAGLADLDEDRKQQLRRLGAEYAAAADATEARDTAAQISAVIDGV